MDRTVTAVLVAAIMAMSCCVLLVSDEGDAAEVKQVGDYEELKNAIYDAKEGDVIQLTYDIEIDDMLNISGKKSITLDLNNHTITASSSFPVAVNGYYNDKHLINIDNSQTIEVTNGVLKTTSLNKHVLNVYDNSDVTLCNVTLDHTVAYTGAPLVVNGSDVILKGKNTFITGSNSWYAINVDSGSESGPEASLSTAASAELVFQGLKEEAIHISKITENDEKFSVSLGQNTVVRTDIENFELVVSEGEEGIIVDVSNADIVPETEPIPEPTPTPGNEDDELPPYIPSQSSNDDDTVTIVACAAAAAVAAILAVFLVIDRK